MRIFFRADKAKASNAVSGNYISEDFALRCVDGLGVARDRVSGDFIDGFIAGLAFIACPRDAEMHGVGVAEYAINAYFPTKMRKLIGKEVDRIVGLAVGGAASDKAPAPEPEAVSHEDNE